MHRPIGRLGVSPLAGLEHLHWRFVGVQYAVAEYLGLERIDQRLQSHAAGTDPLRQGGARDGQTGTRIDAFLAVQGKVVGVLGYQHLGQQAGGGDAFVDHMRLDGCLGDGFALDAGALAADVALNGEHARHIVQLLGHVFTDALHPATALAGARLGLVPDLSTWQIGRQRLAFGLLLGLEASSRWLQLLDLMGHRRQIGLDLVFE